MKKYLISLAFALAALSSQASTVVGHLLDPTLQNTTVPITFKNGQPSLHGSSNLVYRLAKSITATNGDFSVVLGPGNYQVQYGPLNDLGTFSLPDDNNTYNLRDLLASGTLYTYPSSPVYLSRLGGVMLGNVTFNGTNFAGLLLNSLTTQQRTNLAGTNGMLVYDSTLGQVMVYAGGAWGNLAGGGGSQSPWSGTINGANNSLTNVNSISFRTNAVTIGYDVAIPAVTITDPLGDNSTSKLYSGSLQLSDGNAHLYIRADHNSGNVVAEADDSNGNQYQFLSFDRSTGNLNLMPDADGLGGFLNVVGDVHSSGAYYGDGSHLTGITSSGGGSTNSPVYTAGYVTVTNVFVSKPYALTFATNLVTDASLANTFRVTAANSFTLANPTNPTDNQTVRWEITQDGTGGWQLALGNAFIFSQELSSVSIATNAHTMSAFTATYNSAVGKWVVWGQATKFTGF